MAYAEILTEGLRDAVPILSVGVIGLGFLMAVIAAIVLLSAKAKENATRFMLFAVSLVAIGALLEFSRDRERAFKDSTTFDYFARMPSEMFEDYITARTQQLYGSKTVGDERFQAYSQPEVKNKISLNVPSGKCRFYFDTTKPPAVISEEVTDDDLKTREIQNGDYYQSVLICAPADGKSHTAHITLTNHQYASNYVLRVWEATDEDREHWNLFPEEPKKLPPFSKIVCTGEYEGNCPGVHDVFVGCPNRPEQALVQSACGLRNGKLSVIRTGITGNACGYSLFKADCS